MAKYWWANTTGGPFSGISYTNEDDAADTYNSTNRATVGATINASTTIVDLSLFRSNAATHNAADWPTTNYEVSANMGVAGASCTYEIAILRVTALNATQLGILTVLSGQTGTGIKTAGPGLSWANANLSASRAATDRFALALRNAANANMMSVETVSIWADDANTWFGSADFTLTSTTPVEDSLIVKWNLQGHINDTFIPKWNVKATISDASTLKWGVRTGVSDAVTLRWAVRSKVTDAVTFLSHVRAKITDALTPRWDVRSKVTDTSTYVWNVLFGVTTQITDALTLRWPVKSKVTDTSILRWPVKAQVTDTSSYRWSVKSAISDALSLRWPVRSKITDTLTPRWSVAARITDAVSFVWNTLATGKVTDALIAKWDTRQKTQDTFTPQWPVRERLSDAFTQRWAVYQRLTDNLSLLWPVRSKLSDALSVRWEVRARVSDAASFVWNVLLDGGLTRITDAIIAKWDVRAKVREVGADLVTSWNMDMRAALAVGTPDSGYWEPGFRTDATNPDGALRGERITTVGGITLFNYDVPDIPVSPTPVLIRMKAWATTATTLYFWLYDTGNLSDNEAQFAVTTTPTYYEFYQQFNGSGFAYLELGTWNSVPVGTAIYFDDITIQSIDVPDVKIKWGVRSKVTDASQYRWGVRTKITDAITLRWPVRGYVVDAVKAVWNLTAKVARPYQFYWLVKQRTSDTQTLRYPVRARAADTNTYKWSVTQTISKSFKGLFSLSRGETPWGETTPDVQSYSESTPDTQTYSETSDVNSIWTEIPPDTQSWV